MSLNGKIMSRSIRNVGIELLGQLEIQKVPEAQEFLRNLKESFFTSAEQHVFVLCICFTIFSIHIESRGFDRFGKTEKLSCLANERVLVKSFFPRDATKARFTLTDKQSFLLLLGIPFMKPQTFLDLRNMHRIKEKDVGIFPQIGKGCLLSGPYYTLYCT